jgi:hypothetical protein
VRGVRPGVVLDAADDDDDDDDDMTIKSTSSRGGQHPQRIIAAVEDTARPASRDHPYHAGGGRGTGIDRAKRATDGSASEPEIDKPRRITIASTSEVSRSDDSD